MMWRSAGAMLMVAGLLGTGCVPKAKYDALQDNLQECRQRNKKMEERITKLEERTDRRLQEHQEILALFKPLIDKGLIEVEVVEGRTVIGMRAEVLFASGSADLSASGKDTVEQVGRALKDPRFREVDFQVEGHTDSEPISTAQFPDNWVLGSARALAVTRTLISVGLDGSHLSAATFGSYSPVVPNDTDVNKARNRRIEIVMLPDLSDIPGYEKLMEGGRKRRTPGGRPTNR